MIALLQLHRRLTIEVGRAQAVIALVQLYRQLTFKLDRTRHPLIGELELQSGITLAPKHGVWVTAHPRALG